MSYINATTFKELYDRYFYQIRHFIYFKTGDVLLSEDLIQDVFIKIWENKDKVREETVLPYLYKIAGNMVINNFRKKKPSYSFDASFTEVSDHESPEFLIEVKELHEHLKSVLAEMGENERIVFLMSRLDKLTYKEIAQRLELSEKAIEKRMHKALKFMRTKFSVSI